MRLQNNSGTQANTWVRYTFSTSIPIDTGVSISCWVKYTTLTSTQSGVATLYDNITSGFANTISIGMTTSGTIGYYNTGSYYNSNLVPNSISGTYSAGTWYHLAVTFNSSSIIGYLNGVAATPKTTLTTGISFAGLRLGTYVNSFNDNSGFNPADCTIDDLRIYNTALSAAQVQSVYNQQGMPGRAVQTNSPIQPGYIYAPLYNSSIIGTSSPWVVNSQNPDPITSGITGTDNWNTDPNRTNLWSLAPFKYFIFLSRNAYPLNNIPVEGLRYPVLISVTGTYQLSLLVCTGGGNSDSLFWNFDNDAPIIQSFNVPESFGTWYSFAGVTLTAGSHTLSLQMREPVGIGAIKLTSTIYPGTYYNVTPITMTGAPLFNQLSQSATSSAVGAFSLRAVNGVSTRAVNVAPGGAFPITGFSTAATQSTNQFTQTLTGYPFTGSYVANCSTFYSGTGTEQPWRCFDKNNNGTWWTTSGAPYSTSTGLYTAGVYSTTISGSAYAGEWIQIQLPVSITLLSYTIYNASTWNIRAPVDFKIAGSNDGSTWTLVDTQTAITSWLSSTTNLTFTPSNPGTYSYYRLCVNKRGTGDGYLSIGELVLNGTVQSLAQDFYADERGNLLTAPVVGTSLQNWLGGATGYVTKWYDQSGRGNDASQATAANQPIIQRATKGPGYACLFNGANSQVLSCAAGTYSLLNNTKYAVCVTERRNNSATSGGYFGIGDASGGAAYGLISGYFYSETNIVYSHRGDNLDNTVAAYAGASEPIRYTVFDYSASTTKRVYINSSILPVTNTSYDLAAVAGPMTIGKSFATSSSSYYYGEIYEVLVFTKSLYDLDGTTSITQIYNNQVGYTGT